jgi:hypothetical protein
MPGFNRKGPQGEGPRTGRGFGKCNPKSGVSSENDESNEFFGRKGRGIRRGMKRLAGKGNGLRNAGGWLK